MQRLYFAAVMGLGMLTSGPGSACVIPMPFDPEYVRRADVVVGTIENYETLSVEKARQRFREAVRRSPRLAELFGDATPRSLTDRTFFDIRVTEVLRGQAPDMLTVTLGNSKQLAEKVAMARGPYLIALRQRILMLRVPNGVILREPVPGYLTVLDSTCWGGFLFEASSERAALVRKLLKSGAE